MARFTFLAQVEGHSLCQITCGVGSVRIGTYLWPYVVVGDSTAFESFLLNVSRLGVPTFDGTTQRFLVSYFQVERFAIDVDDHCLA